MKLEKILEGMWKDYVELNPQAGRIHDLLTHKGENVVNDHIALRTFDLPKVNIEALAEVFIRAGYEEKGQYDFKEKKLFAKHYQHKTDASKPLIFISQLLTKNFSTQFQETVKKLVDQVSPDLVAQDNFTYSGRPWKMTHAVYQELRKESDYGAWLAAIGYRPNHFTVLINALKSFSEVADLNTYLKQNGFALNNSGGEIKGNKNVHLEQSSTLADNVLIKFDDGDFTVPSCYYEFAKRYKMPNGELFMGFVETSADKIFESTNKGQ